MYNIPAIGYTLAQPDTHEDRETSNGSLVVLAWEEHAMSKTVMIVSALAVGAAVGKNPICFVVPCHRVIGKSGELTGYHWGITRKRAMLGWEAGMAAAA